MVTHQQAAMARAADVARMRKLVRYRIDYHWDDAGRVNAVLTVTLPDRHEFRFTATGDPYEIYNLVMTHHGEDMIGFSLGGLWKGIKKVAKGVATSKVFKAASSVLAVAAPAMGPLAPAAMAAAGGMKAATALLSAKAHADLGNMDAAGTLVSAAAQMVQAPGALNAAAALANKLAPTVIPHVAPKPGGNPFTAIRSTVTNLAQRSAAAAAAAKPKQWTPGQPVVFDSAAFNAARANEPAKRAAAKPVLKSAKLAAAKVATGKPKLLKPASKIREVKAAEQQVYALLLKPA